MKHARIENGQVIEIVAPRDDFSLDQMFHPELLSTFCEVPDEADVGWTDTDRGWMAPVEQTKPAAPRLSFAAFLDLFTAPEQMAIVAAARSDDATKLWYDRALGAQLVDLGDERVIAGVQALVGAGVLKAKRATQVLSGKAP